MCPPAASEPANHTPTYLASVKVAAGATGDAGPKLPGAAIGWPLLRGVRISEAHSARAATEQDARTARRAADDEVVDEGQRASAATR